MTTPSATGDSDNDNDDEDDDDDDDDDSTGELPTIHPFHTQKP